jgi:hypothetical protein
MTDDDLGRDLASFLHEHRDCGTLATGFTGEPRTRLDGVLGRGADRAPRRTELTVRRQFRR